jgi:predicted transport protein
MRDISNIGHWGNGDYQTLVNNDDDLEYIMSLIKQAIK